MLIKTRCKYHFSGGPLDGEVIELGINIDEISISSMYIPGIFDYKLSATDEFNGVINNYMFCVTDNAD